MKTDHKSSPCHFVTGELKSGVQLVECYTEDQRVANSSLATSRVTALCS